MGTSSIINDWTLAFFTLNLALMLDVANLAMAATDFAARSICCQNALPGERPARRLYQENEDGYDSDSSSGHQTPPVPWQ